MMKLSRTVVYALKATIQLAQMQSDSPVPCSRLAVDGEMPERFLLQILRNLVNHGILRSTRGVEGGYTLARPAEAISLLNIIEAIEGPMDLTFPSLNGLAAPGVVVLENTLSQVVQDSREKFEQVKLAQLMEPAA